MKSINTLEVIKNSKIIIVVRSNTKIECYSIIESLIAAGIKAIEITMTVPCAYQIIEEVVDKFKGSDVVIGAGTVSDAVEASNCISAGAEFIVSPIYDKESGKVCNAKGLLYIPGAFTPNEIFHCMRDGFKLVKIFPASWIGTDRIKELKGPFPHLEFLPTGGVSIENVNEWFKAGAYAVAVGSAITKYAKDGKFDKITEAAKAFMNAIELKHKG
jgi:2-dehydro-3-deoxyphosphogluconate aldolase/(4S)-4-hydroxy-2-oxoglutarate aldolase